ncbi:M20 family metallo-hydrolase [Pontibacter sp. G13]|uniref:M20 family metallo-hydrolase n=1 Tax=Pontibacter sp. G13 TaxID=3074898 RepID=UPI002888FEF5|nr:M20 family metallo-hydrolase [Pontibacter sp. G13]WNJ16393.1 M20 family metallo-hydrolase [Pontibacter sp. G13]
MMNTSFAAPAIELLEQLIQTPSLSRQEQDTAELIAGFLDSHGASIQRSGHNIWAKNHTWDPSKPVILLNSHHDTVKPNPSWQRDPFHPTWEGDTLYGLGSNDAGGPLVSLIATFLTLQHEKDLPYNLILAATAEEEISGKNGIASILPELGSIDLGIIGEPTQMDLAIAEKGLMVLDCESQGVAGHAAREEGVNAIYEAMKDIEWFRTYQFEQSSEFLGPVKMSVTQIQAGSQHNVVPDRCAFVVDVRTNEWYSNAETLEIIQSHVSCEVKARSLRLNSSRLSADHPIAVKGKALGKNVYGSPTLSDQALIPYPTLKIGPGDSARSHTADEYILKSEIEKGIVDYLALLDGLSL